MRFARPRLLSLSRSLGDPTSRAAWIRQCSQAAFAVLYDLGGFSPSLVRTSAGWSVTTPSDPLWLQYRPISFSSAIYLAAAEIALEGPALAHLPEPVMPQTFGDVLVFHYLLQEISSRASTEGWRPHLISPLTELIQPGASTPALKAYETLFYEPAFGFIAHSFTREWLNIMDAVLDGDPDVSVSVLQSLSRAMNTFRSLIPRDGWLYLIPFVRFYSDLFAWHSEESITSGLRRVIDAWRKSQSVNLEASEFAFRTVAGIFSPAVTTLSWKSLSDIAEDGFATPAVYREAPLRIFLDAYSSYVPIEGAVVQTYQRFSRTFT